jgi:hypothetical protein
MKCIINFFQALVQAFYKPTTLDVWIHNAAEKTTTDQMLVAAIIGSMAKDITSWNARDIHPSSSKNMSPIIYTRNISFTFGIDRIFKFGEFYREPNPTKNPTINDMPINSKDAKALFDAFVELKTKQLELETATLQAKVDMINNEKKWELVENLLKMKRNEHGALVPIEPAVEPPAVELPAATLPWMFIK